MAFIPRQMQLLSILLIIYGAVLNLWLLSALLFVIFFVIQVVVHFTCQSNGQAAQRKNAILAKGMKLPEQAMTFGGDSIGEINMPKLRQYHSQYQFVCYVLLR